MPTAWSGALRISDTEVLPDLIIHTLESTHQLPAKAELRFLSIVEVSRIPLHLIVDHELRVSTSSNATEQWFSRLLLSQHDTNEERQDAQAWWRTARPDSPLGVLAAVDTSREPAALHEPRVTEVLFYASREQSGDNAEDSFVLHAATLSSDLAVPHNEPTPPASPSTEGLDCDAVFLPLRSGTVAKNEPEVINEPPVRKRKSVTDTFDEATERRKKARRHGGQGVAAAAALKSDAAIPSLKHRRSVSGSVSQPSVLQSRQPSRSPSVASSRPTTARAGSEAPKRSSLSRIQNLPVDTSIESKNKELISRVVMAGMQLYGFSQSKTKKSRSRSANALSTISEFDAPHEDVERQQDDEYKAMYHQLYKSTCFAFRQHIASEPLAPWTEALRETIDRLLAIFSADPLLLSTTGTTTDDFTLSGRKAFGSGRPAIDAHSPLWLGPRHDEVGSTKHQ